MEHPKHISSFNPAEGYVINSHSAPQTTVTLVGNPLSFSRHLIETAHAEFDDVGFIRLADCMQLRHAIKLHDQMPLIVLDETAAQSAISSGDDIFDGNKTSHIAIAYRQDDFAAKILSERSNMVMSGQLSFFPLNSQLDVVISVIRILLCGQQYIPCDLRLHLKTQDDESQAIAQPKCCGLTEREAQVLALVAEGKQNKLVAHQLGLSEHTVKLHMHHILAKLGLANRTEASMWYRANTTSSGI